MYFINKLCIKTKEKNKQENNTAEKDFSITCHVTQATKDITDITSQRKYASVNSQNKKTCTRTEKTVTKKSFQCKK